MIRDSALRSNEKLIMLALLDRADNDTCEIPAWRSPSLLAVKQDTSLASSTVAATIAHIELHGWLKRDGQKRGQKPGTKHSGRGRSATRWALIPDGVVLPCNCAKPDRPSRGQSPVQNVREADHLDCPDDEDVAAGQEPYLTKGGRGEGGRDGEWLKDVAEWGWPEDSVGAEVNEAS
jgi:hypothetical protein